MRSGDAMENRDFVHRCGPAIRQSHTAPKHKHFFQSEAVTKADPHTRLGIRTGRISQCRLHLGTERVIVRKCGNDINVGSLGENVVRRQRELIRTAEAVISLLVLCPATQREGRRHVVGKAALKRGSAGVVARSQAHIGQKSE